MNGTRPYIITWVVLMGLLALTVAASQWLSGWWGISAVSVGAISMVSLIVFSFMGLKLLDALMKIYATGGVLWVGFLVVLTMADYMTR